MAEFSKVTIEFLIDFEIGYGLKMTKTSDIPAWDWVATRSAVFEVTTGTPTATAGETTAINFGAAFLLDYPTDFIVNVTSNTVELISEVEGEDFIGFKCIDTARDPLTIGVEYNATFENYIPPIDLTAIDFALVKSPHYVNIPFLFETTVSAVINLYVWSGDVDTIPALANYTLTIPRPSLNFAEFNVDLSRLIDEQLNPKPTITLSSTTQLVDSSDTDVKWIYYTADYTDNTELIASIEGKFVAVDGYGYYNEGANPTKPTNNILTQGTMRKVSRDGFILFPFVNNAEITSINITSSDSTINVAEPVTVTNESSTIIQYLEVDVSATTTDEFITITTQPAGDEVIYEIVDECRYDPIQVLFKSKYGYYESITLFKKNNISTSTKNDEFVNNYITGGVYDVTQHQYQKLNVTAKKTIKANSGYVNESENVLYEQLLYSDTVFFYEGGALVPVNVKTSSLEFKTRVNDKLINYSLDFEYAYNIIQNV